MDMNYSEPMYRLALIKDGELLMLSRSNDKDLRDDLLELMEEVIDSTDPDASFMVTIDRIK